jgi:penicillin amidase
MLDDTTVLAALRGDITLGGADAAGFAAARNAFLARAAAPRDHHHQASVTETVEILRDGAGVPHIFAATTPDLYFGLGVAMAEDRLWQMDRLRRRAFGRQAEILGAAYVAADLAHLTVGLDHIADREVALVDPATAALVESFVAGINHAIAAMGEALPIEFRLLGYTPEPFTLRDVIGIARAIWWSLNGRIDRLIAAEVSRLLPEPLRAAFLTPEASENLVLPVLGTVIPPIPAGTDDATGSNNWALAGSRTESGLPALAGDPHQPFWVPSSWYEFALHGPEDNAAGSGHPGLPGLWWGSNGTAAWCLTNNMASTRDLYREELDPADPSRYRDGDHFVPFAERTVLIKVRGEADRPVTIRSTVRGPIVNALVPAIDPAGDPPMSLRWVGTEHLDDLRAIIGLARAKTWPDFRAVLQDWSVAVFNWIYADAAGHIGYQMAGRIPLRGRIWPGVRDAGNPDDQWRGMIPFEAMPTRHDPPAGTLASANQRIVGPDFPYPIYGAYSQGHRGVRLDQVFNATPVLDTSATIALQNDVKNTRAERNVRHILSALATSPDPAAQECAAMLTGWDFRYTLDSAAPTLFETFMAKWNRAVQSLHVPVHLIDLAVQQTGLCVSVLDGTVPDYFPEGLAPRIEAVARESIATLTARLGEDRAKWTWGHVHIAHWRHPLSTPANAASFDIGPAPVDGGSHTLRNTGGELPPHQAASGAEYRIVVDFAVPDHFLAVQNIGNSGVPGSPFYRDQFQPWLDGRYHIVHLTRAGVETDLRATTVIEPRK